MSARRDEQRKRSVLASRAGMLLDWSDVEKALLLNAIPLALLTPALARVFWLLRHADDEPYLSRPTLRVIGYSIGFYVVAALALSAWGLLLRRRKAASPAFVESSLYLFFFTNAASAYLVGHFSTPVLAAPVAGTIAVQLLFDPKPARRAAIFGFIALFGPILPIALRLIPYAPLYGAMPFIGSEPPMRWLATTTFFGIVIMLIPLGILSTVLQRWREKDEEIHRLARLDGLTEIANRRYFLERVDVEIVRTSRYHSSLALLLLDLDHFKRINDRHGHQHGDMALVHVANLLSSDVLRRIDVVGRYGGEEFAVMLPETDLEGARVVAERVRAAIERTPARLDDGTPLSITTSIGLAVFPSPGVKDLESLVRRADGALYRAKAMGRNRVEMEPLEERASAS